MASFAVASGALVERRVRRALAMVGDWTTPADLDLESRSRCRAPSSVVSQRGWMLPRQSPLQHSDDSNHCPTFGHNGRIPDIVN